jgi:hypothetical protein
LNDHYRPEELEPWVARIKNVAHDAEDTYAVTNNHNLGKATVNALELRAFLSGAPVRVPPLLLEHYPELKGHCDSSHRRPPKAWLALKFSNQSAFYRADVTAPDESTARRELDQNRAQPVGFRDRSNTCFEVVLVPAAGFRSWVRSGRASRLKRKSRLWLTLLTHLRAVAGCGGP